MTGIVSFGWIVWHLGQIWLPRMMGHIDARGVYPRLVADLSWTIHGLPLTALVTVIGVGAASFHLAHGLWTAAVGWGLLVTRRAQTLASALAVVLGLGLFFLGTNVVVVFATGARLVVIGPDPSPDADPTCAPQDAARRRGAP